MDEQELSFDQIATNLTSTEKAEYLALLKMFESDGWKVLQEQFKDVRNGAQVTFERAPNWDTNRYFRGYIDAVDFAIGYEDISEKFFTRVALEHMNEASAPGDEIEVEDREMI